MPAYLGVMYLDLPESKPLMNTRNYFWINTDKACVRVFIYIYMHTEASLRGGENLGWKMLCFPCAVGFAGAKEKSDSCSKEHTISTLPGFCVFWQRCLSFQRTEEAAANLERLVWLLEEKASCKVQGVFVFLKIDLTFFCPSPPLSCLNSVSKLSGYPISGKAHSEVLPSDCKLLSSEQSSFQREETGESCSSRREVTWICVWVVWLPWGWCSGRENLLFSLCV